MKNILILLLLLTALTAQAQITITPTEGGTFTLTETAFFTGDGWAPGRDRHNMDTSSVINYVTLKIAELYAAEARAYKTLLDARTARLAYLAASPLVSQSTYNATQNARRDSTAFTGDFSMRIATGQPFDIAFQYRTPPAFNRILSANGTFLAVIRPQSSSSFTAVFQSTPRGHGHTGHTSRADDGLYTGWAAMGTARGESDAGDNDTAITHTLSSFKTNCYETSILVFNLFGRFFCLFVHGHA